MTLHKESLKLEILSLIGKKTPKEIAYELGCQASYVYTAKYRNNE